MKFLKSYKIFESKDLDLEKKLKKYFINKHTLNEDGSIDCDQFINLDNQKLNIIPFNFNKINGYFFIHDNQLTSLKNCPKYISEWFECSQNKLTSLEFGPEYVGEDYSCNHNKLITLKGCVDEVYGHFDCSNNQLTSLEFCPMEVDGIFDCDDNKLKELDRSPFIRKEFFCRKMFKTEPEFTGHCEKLIWMGKIL